MESSQGVFDYNLRTESCLTDVPDKRNLNRVFFISPWGFDLFGLFFSKLTFTRVITGRRILNRTWRIQTQDSSPLHLGSRTGEWLWAAALPPSSAWSASLAARGEVQISIVLRWLRPLFLRSPRMSARPLYDQTNITLLRGQTLCPLRASLTWQQDECFLCSQRCTSPKGRFCWTRF